MASKQNPAGYSGTPLPKKLGIREGSVVALVGAPAGFEEALKPLPAGAKLRRGAVTCDLLLWFVRSRLELQKNVSRMGALAPALWIVWPKKASGVAADVSGTEVREAGLAAGLVDYKICALDSTWSGLKFAKRKKD